MKPKSLLNLLLFIISMSYASCSNDNIEKESDNISVDLYLMNEKGEKTTTFLNGENIVVCADLKNSTSEGITLFDETDHSHQLEWYNLENVFTIYDNDGTLIGKAWDGFSLAEIRIPSGESIHWQCCWMEHQTEMPANSPFVINKIKNPLPQGDYYVLFSHYLINNNKIYKINFKIQ